MMDEEIKDLYNSGYSVKEIAELLAMTQQYVKDVLSK